MKYNIKKLIEWCDMQMEQWGKPGDLGELDKPFRQGVCSGYAWMKDHLEHLKNHKKCRCPRRMGWAK